MKVLVRNIISGQVHEAELKESEKGRRPELFINDEAVFFYGYEIMQTKKEGKMKHTSKYEEGYRYFVYVAPGQITYFYERSRAEEFAREVRADVQEVF